MMGLPEPFYSRDGITVFCGDCRDILPLIETASVDLVLADPPYGQGQSDQRRTRRAKHDRHKDGDFTEIAGDREPFDPAPLLRYPRLVLFGANYFADRLPPATGWLVWDKRDGSEPDNNGDAELAWTNLGGVIRMHRQCWRGFARAGDESGKKHLHPTQKPVALMRWILDRWSKPGDLILDPYMGSGPVARACLDLGRRYIGIELEERYCDVAVKRLEQTAMALS